MIAHSAGGGCAASIISKHLDDCVKRVKAIAFTDACQGSFDSGFKGEKLAWVKKTCISYDASHKDLGESLGRSYNHFKAVSAGHEKHVYTTGCAWEAI